MNLEYFVSSVVILFFWPFGKVKSLWHGIKLLRIQILLIVPVFFHLYTRIQAPRPNCDSLKHAFIFHPYKCPKPQFQLQNSYSFIKVQLQSTNLCTILAVAELKSLYFHEDSICLHYSTCHNKFLLFAYVSTPWESQLLENKDHASHIFVLKPRTVLER